MDAKEIGIIIKERRKHLGVEGNPQLSTLLTVFDTLGLQMDIKLKTLDYETV